MLIVVCARTNALGHCEITVPDLPECDVTDPELGRALTRVHLRLEGAIAERMIAGQSLPETRSLAEIRSLTDGADCYEIHINPVHLGAVARHQSKGASR